jgi:hypothetical protein
VPGEKYTIIDNTGVGMFPDTFAGLPDNSTFMLNTELFRIDYDGGDGNDVVLTHLPPPNSMPCTTALIVHGGNIFEETTLPIVFVAGAPIQRAFGVEGISATGTLLFSIDGSTVGISTLTPIGIHSEGELFIEAGLAPAKYKLSVSYSGDSRYCPRTLVYDLIVNPATDQDGDGFSKAVEDKVGTSDTDPTSTPFSGNAAPTPLELNLTSLQIGLNFGKTARIRSASAR